MDRIRVLICGTHDPMSRHIRLSLENQPDMECRFLPEVAIGHPLAHDPERPVVVLLVKEALGPADLETIRAIAGVHPAIRIIAVTPGEPELLPAAFRAGMCGHVDAGDDPVRLIEAVHTAARGGTVLSPRVAGRILDAVSRYGRFEKGG
jgi:DNA-binding NarL/FixJ family response regulator